MNKSAMLFHVDMVYLSKQAKRVWFYNDDRQITESRTTLFPFYVNTKELCSVLSVFTRRLHILTHTDMVSS